MNEKGLNIDEWWMHNEIDTYRNCSIDHPVSFVADGLFLVCIKV